MGFAKVIRIAFAAIAVATMLSSAASAQPFQKPLRWLGQGFSAGYHRCNPGPNVDYYNPWNAHNSRLISNLPQFQNQNFQSYNLNNIENRTIHQGVPFSVYAAPQGQQYGQGSYGAHGYGQGSYYNADSYNADSYNADSYNSGGDSLEGSFEPYDEEEAEEEVEVDDEDVDFEEWQDEDNEWTDDEGDIEDDSARVAPIDGHSNFSNASFPNQSEPRLEESVLVNPFPQQ